MNHPAADLRGSLLIKIKLVEKLYSINIKHIIATIKSEGLPFILICTYLFLEYVRPQSIYTGLDIIPWTFIIVILTAISLLIEKDTYYTGSSLSKLMVAYAIAVLLSSAMSAYPDQSFSRLRIFFDWFIIYFLIVKIVNNERRFFIFLLSFLIYSFKMSQHGTRSFIMRGFSFADWGVVGAPGFFHNSGEVGIQMCIFVPLSIAFIFSVYKHLSKIWLMFFSLMPTTGTLTIIASSSRGAVIGLFGSGIWAIKRRPKYFILGVIMLAIALLAIYKITPPEFKHRFESAGEDKTSLLRMERWRHGLDGMQKHPFFGVGFAVWDIYYPKHYTIEHRGTYLAHNIFIQSGSELGYLGLFVFLSMIIASFMSNRTVRKLGAGQKDKFLSTLSYGFDAAMIGFLLSGSFVTVLYYPYFWIQCALTASLYTAAKRKYTTEGPKAAENA